jgi:hypothetical protein
MKILFENKQLNEGPGAGYTVSGTLTNVKVNNIKGVEEVGRDGDLVEYEVELDATADFEDVSANSYYYGGKVNSTPVSIIRARVEFNEGEITNEDVKWAIENVRVDANLGGGWSHSTFDGCIEVNYMGLENTTSLTGILFELTDTKAVTYLDRAVQNSNEETQYVAFEEDNWMGEFDTEEEAIAYAQKYGANEVKRVVQRVDFDDDVEIVDEETVWTADGTNESLTDEINKKSKEGVHNGSVQEMSNIIFDTLFGNSQNPQFDFNKVENQEVGNNQIVFDYAGHEYKITVEKSDGNFNESIKRPLTEGFKTGERIQALATYLDIDPSEISNTYGNEFETPEGDYLVVDEDEAEQLARDDIENLFDELGLDSFTPDFRDWIIMNALDNDWFEDAVRESYESYVDDIEYEGDDIYENRLIQELYDEYILTDDDFEQDEDGEPDYTTLLDSVDIDDKKSEYIDLLIYRAGDPVDYCGDNFGWEWVSNMATTHNLIDMDEVVEQCIYMDGVAHFIARYDGNEIELGNGLYAYRTN